MVTNDRAEDRGLGGEHPLVHFAYGDGFPLWTLEGTKQNTSVMTPSQWADMGEKLNDCSFPLIIHCQTYSMFVDLQYWLHFKQIFYCQSLPVVVDIFVLLKKISLLLHSFSFIHSAEHCSSFSVQITSEHVPLIFNHLDSCTCNFLNNYCNCETLFRSLCSRAENRA